MISAQEAKEKTNKALYGELAKYLDIAEKAIEAAIIRKEFSAIISHNHSLFDKLKLKLNELGYTVVKQPQSCSGYEVKISWENV